MIFDYNGGKEMQDNISTQFCSYCGAKLDDGASFCKKCGKAVSNTSEKISNTKQEESYNGNPTERKTVYEGYIHKCPNCGEVLGSFTAQCPSCGYEIRGAGISKAVSEFSLKLVDLQSDEEKISLIRNFPIPNSKEDIYEFMILASTNIGNAVAPSVSDAWITKVEQCYQKAQVIFSSEADLNYIQKSYDECHHKMKNARKNDTKKTVLQIVIKNITVVIGLVFVLAAVIANVSSEDISLLLEMIGYILLIASAVTLVKRKCTISDYGVGLLSGIITIGLSFLLDNGSMGILCGIATSSIVIYNYFKQLGGNSSNAGSSSRPAQHDENKVKVPFAVINGNYENYAVAETLFIQAGFTNVKTIPLNDLTFGLLKKSGEVESITINGRNISSYFTRKFDADAAVLITYHSMR